MANKKRKYKQRNFVQKHSLEQNKAQTFTDRKKAKKKGYQKHKGRYPNDDSGFFVSI